MFSNDGGAPAPVAIVGMSCRLSGGVSTLDDFWTLLSRSRSGWCEIPEHRFSKDAYYHPNPQKKGCINVRSGYFLDRELSTFDAPFFNITDQEALAMDPQQRQLLECAYEAFENAGIPKESIAGRNIGVFVGGRSSDYRVGSLRDLNQMPMFDATGNHQSIQAGRLSYYFDLRGPCYTVDTACSSSMYALHHAVQSIRSGESEQAIVAGCSLHLQPDDAVSMSMLGIFNSHGKTFSFDHRAESGFARGEGIGCLVLKPLDQALKDNDKVWSVIVNTGTNQDGKTIGLSTPSGEAQERLMRDVYAKAGINPEDAGFVEAHGTGTKVGDPIEAAALYQVFGSGRTKRAPLYIGSVKSNVGHLENASGIISIIKASLMLDKGFILPNINFEKPNDKIPLDRWNMKVPVNIRPWPKDKRFISVNNFGFGGSNAHAVLARSPLTSSELPQESEAQAPKLYVLSAHDETAAKRMVSQLSVYLEQHPAVFQKRLLRDVAYTLANRRSHLPWRIALVAANVDHLASALNNPTTLPTRSFGPPKLAFVYTGQGAQWAAMGRELMQSHHVFAEVLQAADQCLQRLGADFSLIKELSKDKSISNIAQAHISQPACTAIQLGLTVLLASWRVRPSAVTGHSSGEIAAAFAAGAISLDDAMAIAYHRGQAARKLKTNYPHLRGSMLAVGAGAVEVKEIIRNLSLTRVVVVACENSPASVTMSGDEEAVDQLAAELTEREIFNRKLHVDMAYHSPHMQLAAEDYLDAIQGISSTMGSDVKFYSSLLGTQLDSATDMGPSYWVDNLTRPVLFSPAMRELIDMSSPNLVIEIGPHSALEGPIKQIIKTSGHQGAAKVKYHASLVRNQDATASMVELAAALFVKGQSIDFDAINETDPGLQKPALITDLYPYPWSNHMYWHESRVSRQHRLKPYGRHDLLGILQDSYNETRPSWCNVINSDEIPWLKDHQMQSLVTFPLAGYLCMAVEAASQRAQLRGVSPEQVDGFKLREVQASKAFILDDGEEYETLVTLQAYAEGTRSYSDDWDEFCISSWSHARGWIEHCRGLVAIKKAGLGSTVGPSSVLSTAGRLASSNGVTNEVSLESFYSELDSHGAGYGPIFRIQSSGDVKTCGRYSTAKVKVPDTSSTMNSNYETVSILSPPFIDLIIQLTFPILGAGCGDMKSLFMPSAIKEAEFSISVPRTTGDGVEVVAERSSIAADNAPVDFCIQAWCTPDGTQPVVKLDGFRMMPVQGVCTQVRAPRPLCYKVKWESFINKSSRSVGEINGTSSSGFQEGLVHNCVVPNGAIQNGIQHVPDTNGDLSKRSLDFTEKQVIVISSKARTDPLLRCLISLIQDRSGIEPTVCSFENVEVSQSPYICLSELDAPLLYNMSAATFERVQKLLLGCSSILWVSSGAYMNAERPHMNVAQGLLRTVRSELSKAAATLDLSPSSQLNPLRSSELIIQALEAILDPVVDGVALDYEFAEDSQGNLMVPRVYQEKEMDLALCRETQVSDPYVQDFEQPGRPLKIAIETPGALDSIYFLDDADVKRPLGKDEIEVRLAATGVNFKDVVISMGQLVSPYIGIECSGTVTRVGDKVQSLSVGDRVAAMSFGAYSTFARCPATSAVVIPNDMSFETAASIPVVYSTAYYGLIELARLRAGERVLIHAGSGGVGQAAIQLSQMIGAEIYATVGSAEKKKFLVDTYAVPESHIFFSRSTAFGADLKAATGGAGVDVAINSLAGDLLRETWECMAHFGRFIEIGKRDITANTRLEMSKFEYNCTFSSVDLTLVAMERPIVMGRVLTAAMDLLRKGLVKPISPINFVEMSDIVTVLRGLQSGKTLGKLVVNHQAGGRVKATHPPVKSTLLPHDATYVIAGGTGGLGRSIAKRLVHRGARHIVLLSRSGKLNHQLCQLSEEGHRFGAVIDVKACDIADEASVSAVIATIQETMPPIRGMIHAAMVLRDVLFEKMTFEEYSQVVRSKVNGAWNLHNALLDTRLDFFIMLSSVAGIVGNRGQAAYAAANTFLDALMHHRLNQGLVATSLDLTAIEDVGYLAENTERQTQVLKTLSGNTMVESEVLTLVELSINGMVQAHCGGQCVTGLDFSVAPGADLPYYASDGRFSHLRDAALDKRSCNDMLNGVASLSISQKLQRAQSVSECVEIVTAGLCDKLGAILMIPNELMLTQKASVSVAALGLDSLNAIELRNWIAKELLAHLQVLELLMSRSLVDLASLVLKKSTLEGVVEEPSEEPRR
ncbi:hypothetical protein JX266_007608 [Neoarthrinium moseri]|nr:hypothetical protein JX266_007608 [Neoarthrinium moseri]